MTKEKRKEIKETFAALEEMLLQKDVVKSIVTTVKLTRLLANAKDCLHELNEKKIPRNDDFRFDIAKAVEAIENCRSEIEGGRSSDEWLNKARERLHVVNDCLSDWHE